MKIKVKKFKKEQGITLVALIITIIVLLILAMVSIRLVMNGGIIDRADNSVKTYSNEEIAEQLAWDAAPKTKTSDGKVVVILQKSIQYYQ
jgi:flagellar basal body-associated protein FliL